MHACSECHWAERLLVWSPPAGYDDPVLVRLSQLSRQEFPVRFAIEVFPRTADQAQCFMGMASKHSGIKDSTRMSQMKTWNGKRDG